MIPIIPNCHTCDHLILDDEMGYVCDSGIRFPDAKSLDDPCDCYEIDIDYVVRQLETLKWWGFVRGRHSCDDCAHARTGRDSAGCEDWNCAMGDNPCLPFIIDDDHPCPLWEEME